MTTRKFIFSILAIGAICATQVGAADWAVDYDSPLPASWVTAGNTQSGSASPTFVSSVSGGVLRLSDTLADDSGGSFSAFGGTTDDVFTDVIVGSDVNKLKDSDDDLGVVARVDLNTGSGYFGAIDFELGEACITKVQGFSTGADLVCSAAGSLDKDAAYHIQLTATGGSTTDLTLDVYESAGGTLVQSISASDDGSIAGFGPAYTGGVAGVFMVPKGTTIPEAAMDELNGTFDNSFAKSVPEPSTSLIMCFGVAGLLGWRRRVR